MINIALMGHGVVGAGVVELLETNAESIGRKCGSVVNVKYILDLKDGSDTSYQHKFINDFNIILNDDSVTAVVEAMGGLNPAYKFVKALLLAGKSVITPNKELVAVHGAELLQIAKERNINFLFEASVGGGIPIIRPIFRCMAANEIDEIYGILNGTTNFILTKMIREKMSFDVALNLAQELGYAEADPTADVDGHDTCRKICILASLAFGSHVSPGGIYTEGIRDITLEDAQYAQSINYVIKLVGRTVKVDDKITVAVHPMMIGHDNPLFAVEDVFNAVVVKGSATDEVMFYGKGAGKMPTASAVVADIIDSILHTQRRKDVFWGESKPDYILPQSDSQTAMFIRTNAPEVDIEKVFGEVQYLAQMKDGEVAFITKKMSESEILQKLKSLKSEVISTIRVLD